jgi:hypothetical protein
MTPRQPSTTLLHCVSWTGGTGGCPTNGGEKSSAYWFKGGAAFGAGLSVIHFGQGTGSTSAMDLDVAYVGKAAGS